MPYLQHETARLTAASQAAGVEIASLTAQLQAQQQAIAAAQARATAARSSLAAAQAQMPSLEAAAASADRRVAELDVQIDELAANEPDMVIEVSNKPPRPNPAWRIWKRQFDQLSQQRALAQASAAAAHARLSDGRAQVARAAAEVQTADSQVAAATSAQAAIQGAITAAQARQAALAEQLAVLERWNQEIARDPLDRAALEPVAAALSGRAAALGDAHAQARVQNEIAQETLAALIARRDQITPILNDLNAQLPAASQELLAASRALTAAARAIQTLLRRGPRP